MKLVSLIDDISRDQMYLQEHGACYYLQTEKHRILIDTGASDAFIKNAERLGINLSKVDTVILTHGHASHCGGIKALKQIAPKAAIYVRANAFGEFYSSDNASSDEFCLENAKFVGIDPEIKTLKKVRLIDDDTVIDDELQLFTNVSGNILQPSSRQKFKRMVLNIAKQDDFSHELFLLVRTEGKIILFTGCCHSGIINVMETCKERFSLIPDIVVGGFHLMQSRYCGFGKEDFFLLDDLGTLLREYPTKFYTGHCTGIIAYNKLKAYLGKNISYMYSGDNMADV